jgi:hypothetical protein
MVVTLPESFEESARVVGCRESKERSRNACRSSSAAVQVVAANTRRPHPAQASSIDDNLIRAAAPACPDCVLVAHIEPAR